MMTIVTKAETTNVQWQRQIDDDNDFNNFHNNDNNEANSYNQTMAQII